MNTRSSRSRLFALLIVLHTSAPWCSAFADDVLPGPRDCFWTRGPVSGDPYINVAYPDTATFYWAAVFTMPEGTKLRLEGNFPHARYMSFISYDGAGRPIESLPDYLIEPATGSVNPYIAGSDRETPKRQYQVEILNSDAPDNQPVGMQLFGQSRQVLHTPEYGKEPGQQVIVYRIYVVDEGQDETGGAGLPQPVLVMNDGTTIRGPDICKTLRTMQPLQLDPAALAVPLEKYRELLKAAARISPLHPSTNPPTWYQQLDRKALYGIYTGELAAPDARKSEGGFYPNLDNQYIRTILNRGHGPVFVLRAKAPTTPHTHGGQPDMGEGQLRYWSWCSNQGFANTRVNDCVHDEKIPVGPDGYYTLVVSRAADRPRNAVAKCGVAWLPMADDGDGAGDEDVTILQLRHMLGTRDFPNAIQGIRSTNSIKKDMGEYFPRGRYMTRSAFEVAMPCINPA